MQLVRGDQKVVGIDQKKIVKSKQIFKKEDSDQELVDEDKPTKMLDKNEFTNILDEHLQDMEKRKVRFKEDLDIKEDVN